MDTPVILAVDDDQALLSVLKRDLCRRYGADYSVLTEAAPSSALETLRALTHEGREVALLVAGREMAEMSGVDYLARAGELHPQAKRLLLIPIGALFSSTDLLQAMALGELDYWMHRRWEPVEEILYPIVGDLLADWSRATRRPRYETVRVVGEASAPRSHELRSLLERSMLPYGFYPHDSGEGRRLLMEVGQDGTRLPVVIIADEHVLLDPSNSEVLAPLGVKTRPAHAAYDVVVVGAGPAGLSSAVYAASEGLRTLILEPEAAGGQAAASSRIRNYLGFPRGISGGMLAMWAFQQAVLFGAEFVYQPASHLKAHGAEYVVSLHDGSEVRARAVIVSTGVSYRRLNVPGEDRFVGSGVFYGAASSELPAVRGQHVFVVGAGNSAGQAAIHLAAHASHVTLLVRGDSLVESMSAYLIRELDVISNVTVRLRTRVAEVRGTGRLEGLRLQDTLSGEFETVAAGAMFLLIGGQPRTEWLRGVVDQDSHGYVLTGPNCVIAPRRPVPPQTSRALLETSAAGVFAAGDVRHGSVKRVATAVGEGAMAVRFVHEFLQRPGLGPAPAVD